MFHVSMRPNALSNRVKPGSRKATSLPDIDSIKLKLIPVDAEIMQLCAFSFVRQMEEVRSDGKRGSEWSTAQMSRL